jgi:hypothetical protein
MIIRLPNLTYPDCEICDCIDEDAQDYEDDPYAEQSSNLTQNNPSGLIYDFTNIYQYKNLETQTGSEICCPTSNDCNNDANFEDDPEICEAKVLAVQMSIGGSKIPPYSFGGVNVIDKDSPALPKRGWVSTSLPIAERINLFNAKSKFFQGTPGEGNNRIRVSFEPDLKPTSSQVLCHEDNVVIIVVDKNQISQYKPGQLLSFQDANLSKDVNVKNLVTGQTTTGVTQITVSFANSSPNGGNSTRNYSINLTGSTTTQAKFPMDIEYYQVIYTTPLVDMKTDSLNGGLNTNSFFGKVFSQASYLNRVRYNFGWDIDEFLAIAPYNVNKYPYEFMEDWQSLGVIVMVRGVDPHTPKIDIQYDISRIFGQPVGNKVIRGNFHLNIPIQGGYRCVRHQNVSNNNDTDEIGNNLFFPTYNNFNIEPQKFTGYNTNLHTYYVSLDATTYGSISVWIPGYGTGAEADPYKCGRGIIDNGTNGLIIFNSTVGNEDAINDWVNTPNVIGAVYTDVGGNGITPTTLPEHNGYMPNEKVEGCSYAHLSFWGIDYNNFGGGARAYGAQGIYHSRKYDSTNMFMNIQHSPQSRYVMRSDRLPTSTYDYVSGDNHMALQQNTGLSIFKISEDGTFASSGSFAGGGGFNGDSNGDNTPDDENPAFVNEVLESFTCGEQNSTLVPLGCYEYDAAQGTIYINDPDCFFKNPGNVEYFKNNCYQMVTKPLISIPVDVLTLTEWLSRIKIFFGLCQGVFRHMFTNSWINGTLFAFSFKNDRFFDTRYNRPYNKTCKDTVYFHRPTNNFFYRSSPYDNNGSFIGRDAPTPTLAGIFGYFGGNMKNLMFPTTLMDLGPRDEISKFLSQNASEEYEGYVVNKISTTSFNEIDEILNLFIISRLASTNFLQQFFGAGGASILSYFTREKSVTSYYSQPYDYNVKNKNMVDSDYAQLISINSEFGIVPFDIENYPSDPNTTQQETIFFNGQTAGGAIIGIFFSSYTQNRDFISPKRIIYNQSAPLAANSCNLNPIPIRDQQVPFYQWSIQNNGNIFGSQKGHWYTVGISNGVDNFHSFNYQSLDRLNSQSRFFMTQNQNQADFYKGYIYSVDSNGIITADPSFTDPNTIISNGDNVVTAGGPFFFYFGLNRGASAMDRFITKWVNTDNAVE